MTAESMTEASSHTVEVPGATIAYDVRPADKADKDDTQPVLFMIGSPMGAAGFG